ncbi:UDP-N-acetylmuramoyl-tripeptide--D-alanyl-D-alanine ligase [Thermanaerothrix sp. 4228-RoL]|jgi:UDP-N-acetylmuramoyl-tripeptide--D-alanyl-D-alanine ligase|uniref:UDP-N-acetylmuramoyl-tripeptide--D-alanyl-D-alanine ligase n=1 Tax=Thermanaerothrix solaris TaxID=3058434 RepID=A0ABU3NT85_9CHLR|nr:UDP-N-acetylmuramoyl-tripeptide--D-alanyl-D-alanine ligase [Thermanaerothrix sp. 4228-RoL]MDT8899342.1 UDP-N-acetylmuramoyl-tripeptide--D-alanyl-D-alanine ligase [Thermanaerothrix sp. 4228-RoL]
MITLGDILEALTGKRPAAAEALALTEAAVDSRQIIPGGMFFALPGEHADGHDFVEDAFGRGALLAFIQHEVAVPRPSLDLTTAVDPTEISIPEPPFMIRVSDTLRALQDIARFWRRKFSPRVIGITGSVGKSTTKEVVAEVLSQRYRTLKNPGNLNNEIGLPLTLLRLGAGYDCAVLEMGFYVPGEIAFLCDLALPQIGIITNIGTVHAERAGSQEAIARGKSELVQALPPAPEGVAILNYDDPWVRWMADKTQARIFYYGLDPKADLWADNIESQGLKGIRFQLHLGRETLHLRVPMLGRHAVQTALRAAAAGLVCGLSWQEIIHGLQQARNQLRLVAVRLPNGALVLDDSYNAAPESMLAALNLLNEIEGRRIAVLGDMLELGPYEAESHRLVGIRAAEVADHLITLGQRARLIAESALQAGLPSARVVHVEDTTQAVEVLRQILKEGDVVLVKGSHGLRMDRIVAALEEAA